MSETETRISFVVPCYNEEASIRTSIPRLVKAFMDVGVATEIVAVNNGSHDRTGAVIRELADSYPQIVPCEVEVNQGYGFGVLNGIPLCSAPLIGIIPADGQVDAEDVVRLYEAASSSGLVLAKARRRFRMDGFRRKIISICYNLFVRMLWPRMDSLDINGTPKILPRSVLQAMHLKSREWFLDPEIMIKAHHMGLRIVELNVFARARESGASNVKMGTGWEFFWKVLSYRFSGGWKKSLGELPHQAAAADAVRSRS